ncbi:hypothetical protein [Natrinema sp. SYSU A 869]|uniref:hypothetical protein n=1 Tax=Natrinema sp. SYSU A 869 TaxID=2871694 RepID=UPI001CA3BE79|nr:hypothetical protein [Natrinema sp. SYSU A 869]
MVPESVTQFRNRIDRSDIVATVVLVGVLTVLGVDVNGIAMVLGVVVAAPLVEAALDRADIDAALAWLCFGLFAVAAGVVELRAGNHWFGGSLFAIGCWICLDGVYAWRSGSAADQGGDTAKDDDMTKNDVLLVSQHNRWLLEELREADRPLTKAEICDRTGLMDDDFERLLEFHDESSPIERIGNGYALDEDEMGASAFVRNTTRTVGGRIFRPFRLFRRTG